MAHIRKTYEKLKDGCPGCPSAEEIERYLANELDAERHRRLEFHLNSCPQCIELMERLEDGADLPELPELDQAWKNEQEREVARRLGFEEPEGGGRSLLERFSWLWTVRAPLLVPVGVTALLIAVLWMAGGPDSRRADPDAGFTPVSLFTVNETGYRNDAAVERTAMVRIGEVLVVEIFFERLDLVPGDAVRYAVTDGTGALRLEGGTAVLEDYNVRAAIAFPEAGTFGLVFSKAESGETLAEVKVEVKPPAAAK